MPSASCYLLLFLLSKQFLCKDVPAVTRTYLMGTLCILSLGHFSDVRCKSSSLTDRNNKMKSQTKQKGDETLNCPQKTFDNNCQAA